MIDLEAAREALRSHNLSALLIQSLNWSAPDASIEPIYTLSQHCIPVAQRGSQTAWQIILTQKTRFTPTLRYQIYSAVCEHEQHGHKQRLHTQGADSKETASKDSASKTAAEAIANPATPLVIIVDASKTRSLWCAAASESALYVVDQPMALWNARLRRLATGGGLYPDSNFESGDLGSSDLSSSDERFETLLVQLRNSIHGIEDIAHQRSYAALTLRRLILIQRVQQKGWLASDPWYLQSQFGQWLQHKDDAASFFEACLQPLYQSLSLPEIERSVTLKATVGEVPFLGGLFETHRLEAAYGRISIEDTAIENILGWLSEQVSTDRLNPWLSGTLGYWLAQTIDGKAHKQTDKRSNESVIDPNIGRLVCDRTLDALIQQRLERTPTTLRPVSDAHNKSAAPLARHPKSQTLNDQLFNADAWLCRRLIQEVLPALRILDPACGSGQLLVAFHQRLTEILSILTGHIQQNQDAQLKIWRSGLVEMPESKSAAAPVENFVQTIQQRILGNLIYGVDVSDDAIESARLYLLMHLVETAATPADIEPLLDLDFNLLTGHALVGFITVDEERFDQVNQTGSEQILQGNLLQPLAADSYQTILREKNITLEHYQSRTVLLAKTHNVPSYARAALLKEEILTLDQKAQKKLDRLLLDHMSQQLGIRYRATQLIGKPRHRPLIQQDIEKLQPFHFGYHFHDIIKAGGFDIIACYPPWSALRPTVADFIQQFPTLAKRANIDQRTFKTSKPELAKVSPEVSEAWLNYQDQYAYTADYFQRSELYAYQRAASEKRGRSQLATERLFVERSLRLLSPSGLGLAIVPAASFQDPKAAHLQRALEMSEGYGEFTCDAKTLAIVWSKAKTN